MAALLVLGSFEVERGEPDLRFLYGYEKVGIAAKRIRSLSTNALKSRVDKAVDQIEETRYRGWIALNLDTRFASISPLAGRDDLLRKFDNAFDSVNSGLARHVENQNVLGLMAYGFVSEWRAPAEFGEPRQLAVSFPFRWLVWTGVDPAEDLLFKDVVEGWQRRVQEQFANISRGKFE